MKTLLTKVLAQARLHAAHPGMLVEVYTVSDRRLIWASPSHRDILGYDPQELIGIHWKEIVEKSDHDHKSIMLEDALLTGGSMEIGFHILAKSGSRVYVKVIDTLYEDPGVEEKYVICRSTQVGHPRN